MPLSRRALLVSALAAALVGGWRWKSGDWARAEALKALRAPPMKDGPDDLIRFATLAANGHNTQPWLFEHSPEAIRILPDHSRATPVVDPDDHHLWASLGCAAENLSLAAGQAGQGGAISLTDEGPVVGIGADTLRPDPLFDAILTRQTTRAPFDGTPITPEVLTRIETAARDGGAEVITLTTRAEIDAIADLVIAGNTAQMADPAFVAELKQWIRFSPHQAGATGDGLYAPCSGNPPLPAWAGPQLFDMAFKIDTENAKYREQMDTTAAVMVIVAPTDDPIGWMQAGRSSQRLQLQATLDGVRTSFVNQAVEVPQMRANLQTLLGLGDRRPNLVLRLGHGLARPMSLRRPVAQVTRTAPA